MFTGIIEETGRIKQIGRSGSNNFVAIACNKILSDLKLGDSIAVNGICLTVKSFDNHGFVADVMPVTFQKTNLKMCKIGDFVNLERALQLDSRLGGHLVSGHIDGTGKIISRQNSENAVLYKISVEAGLQNYLVSQGSVCLDGISLTISKAGEKFFEVSIIPETLKNTILQYRQVGDLVNIEVDIIGKYVYNFLKNSEKQDISMNFLKENGFA